jgi:hypothetical protein
MQLRFFVQAMVRRMYVMILCVAGGLLGRPDVLVAQPAVQTAIPGSFVAPFSFLNGALTQPLDIDGNGQADVISPCSCGNMPTIPNGAADNTAGIFHDQLIVATGISGQQWRILASNGVLSRTSLQPLPAGTTLPEVGQTGIYVLPMAHRSEEGYSALLQAPVAYPGQFFGPLESTCYYPRPQFSGLDNFYCVNDGNAQLAGLATTGFDNHQTNLEPPLGFFSVVRESNQQVINTSVFSPSTLGAGQYRVRYLFDAGNQAYTSPEKTGCVATAESQVTVSNGAFLACLSSLNLSFPTDCSISVSPQLVVANASAITEAVTVSVFTNSGINLGTTIPATYAGQTLRATVFDECSGLSCNTQLTVRDVSPPVLQVPPDRTLSCEQSTAPTTTGVATATDCTATNVTFTDEVIENECAVNPKVIRRTWRAVDAAGNAQTGVQTIRTTRIRPGQIRFPQDRVIGCAAYSQQPALASPTASGAGLPALVEVPGCGLSYTHTDDTLRYCGTNIPDMIIRRTWFLLDECGTELFTQDSLGNDNVQFIRIADTLAPLISAANFTVGANLPPEQANGICLSRGSIPAPIVTDNCNAFSVRIFTPLGEAVYGDGQTDGRNGGRIPAPGLPPGVYNIVYQATDECGNVRSHTVQMSVVDVTPPISICRGQLNISLPPDGNARIWAADIDGGSRDYCCADVDFEIKLQSASDSTFAPYLDLFCTNASIVATLRVTDCNGFSNICFSTIVVEDRQPVVLSQAPPTRTISCGADYSAYLQASFDAPIFTDNCNFSTQFTPAVNVDSCGIGYIDRRWEARDNPGNAAAVYIQRINILPAFAYSLDIPADVTTQCDAENTGTVVVSGADGCSQLQISYTDNWLRLSSGPACYERRRTFTIINPCEYNGVAPPTLLERYDGSDPDINTGDSTRLVSEGGQLYRQLGTQRSLLGPSTGYYQYLQIIRIVDTVPPTIFLPSGLTFCVPAQDSSACSAEATVPLIASDACPDTLTYSYLIRLNQQGNAVADTLGQLFFEDGQVVVRGIYPLGRHELVVTVRDACNNAGTRNIPFAIADCTPPQLTCVTGLTITLGPSGSISIPVQDLVSQLSDNCGSPRLTLNPTDFTADSLSLDCDDLGSRSVIAYAIDQAGLRQSCTALITVTSEGGCNEVSSIEGHIRTESGNPVKRVKVYLSGGHTDSLLTDDNGYYRFENLPAGLVYTVRPWLDTLHANGVSTFDLIQINRHILATQYLTSPYDLIAADANRSGNITTLDAIRIRRVILNLEPSFPGNTSWRFVDANHTFGEAVEALQHNYPEQVQIDTLLTDETVNFVGVKIGDVNESASTLVPPLVSVSAANANDTAQWLAEKVPLSAGWQPPWPNPFGERINFSFILAEETWVQLRLLDVTGRLLVHKQALLPAGVHEWVVSPPLDRQLIFYQMQLGTVLHSGTLYPASQ